MKKLFLAVIVGLFVVVNTTKPVEARPDNSLLCRGTMFESQTGDMKRGEFELDFYWNAGIGRWYKQSSEGRELMEEFPIRRDSNYFYLIAPGQGEATIDRRTGVFKSVLWRANPDDPNMVVCSPLRVEQENRRF